MANQNSVTREAVRPDIQVAVWQCAYLSAHENSSALNRLDRAAAQAKAAGADVLVCPEMNLSGYAVGAPAARACAQPLDGPWAQAVAAIAQQNSLALVYGYPEQHERHAQGERPYNACQFIDEYGQRLGNYRKTHLYGDLDKQQFSAGHIAPSVFEWRGWHLGLLICYDVEFPETVRSLALQGADAVLVPTANMVGFESVQKLLLPARAWENQLYVAYANACGPEADLHYNGLSTVCGPQGQVLAQAGGAEELLLCRWQKSALQAVRQTSVLGDRRPDLYAHLLTPHGGG